MFKKSYISFLAILFFVSGLSAVPNMLNYRGKLFESGMPANGNRTVTFRIYDQLTLGTLLWNSGPIGIDVNNGYYHYTMTVPSVLFGTNNDLYLDVDIGGSSLVPRERLVAVGYALNADMVDGMHASDLGAWKKTGADIYYTNGNVGIGILNPIFQLDIQGTNRMTAFRMEPGAGSSRVLTSDAAGNGSWQSLSGLGAISGSGTGNYIPRFGIGSTISNSMIYQDNNRIRISDSTTAPTSTLYVSSTNSDVSGVDGIFVDIQNRNTTLKVMNGVRFWNGTTANTFKGAIYYQDEKGYGVGNMIFANNINSAAAGNATISDARMVISTNGAIGIGTLSPARALHLYNNSFMVGPVNDRSLEVDSKDIYLGDIDGGSMNNYLFIDAEGSGDFLFLRGNHVGINTNKPSAKLHIVNSLAEDSFRVDDQAGGDTTPFVIDGSGNVGVGTNKPNRVVELRNGWPYVRFADTDGGNYWEAGARGDQNRFL
ncbi:MAG: hypothetical protein KKH98_02320, partial [Spirochaetes bacterium]|nr:hypothetical protein [Spirochaetota bacterium]